MGNKISKIIVAQNIKVDRDYNNVTDADMLGVVQANQVASRDNYSFIRRNRNLQADFNYSQILNCNYMAFQNTDYSNKWFFAWIDNIEYINDSTVEIEFTVDIWSTWFSSLQKLPVFVEREHVADDRFGYHILPEPVKPDKYITSRTIYKYYDTDFRIVIFMYPNDMNLLQSHTVFEINNRYVAMAAAAQYPATQQGISEIVSDFSAAGTFANYTIITAFMLPASFLTNPQGKWIEAGQVTSSETITFSAPRNLNGYVPVNKKCFIFPYNYIAVSNGNSEKIYHCEKFGLANEGAGDFKIVFGVLPNGAATMYPMAYNGIVYENVGESLTLNDFPQVASMSDSYAAWLAQKSSGTVMQGIMSTLTGALAGGLHGGYAGAAVGAVTGLVGGVVNYVSQDQAAKASHDNMTGSNNADMDFVQGLFGYTFQQRSCMADDAERIDRFFSQFGYNVSITKLPNYTGRQYWNYVKVSGSAGYGAMPESARNELNRILNQGVTIWHSHDYLGNYFIGGNKMENPIV